jgi:hypothetical protein
MIGVSSVASSGVAASNCANRRPRSAGKATASCGQLRVSGVLGSWSLPPERDRASIARRSRLDAERGRTVGLTAGLGSDVRPDPKSIPASSAS